jgi:hypothetical protein
MSLGETRKRKLDEVDAGLANVPHKIHSPQDLAADTSLNSLTDTLRKQQKKAGKIVPKTGDKPARKTNFWAIGVADPGTGQAGGFFFTKDELIEIVQKSLILKTKVWLEHGDGSPEVIGMVRYAWVDKRKGLMVMMEFDYSTLMSNVVLEWMRSGLFAGISLGYKSDVEYVDGNMNVVRKTINEVSVVRDPYHKSCRITFVGTKIPNSAKNPVLKKGHSQDAHNLFPYF